VPSISPLIKRVFGMADIISLKGLRGFQGAISEEAKVIRRRE
jgi:hypothetical protein